MFELANMITPAQDGEQALSWRIAVVTSVSPLLVQLSGAVVPATAVEWAGVVVSDVVVCLTRVGAPPLVLGPAATTLPIINEPPQAWNVTQVVQGAPRACTTSVGWYQRSNGAWRAQLTLTGFAAGVAGNALVIPTPFTLTGAGHIAGSFVYNDSGTTFYTGGVYPNSTSNFVLIVSGNAGFFGQLPSVALASGDGLFLSLQGRY